MKIILASASPRRVEVMKRLGIPFEVKPSNFDEDSLKVSENNPAKLVEALALEKARSVAREHPEDLIIGADTMTTIDGKIVGKPKDLSEAKEMLLSSSEKYITTYNGLAVIYKGKEKSTSLVNHSAKFKRYGESEILDYFSKVNPLDKAGGWAADPAEGGGIFLESFHGEPGEELGLPMDSLKKFLRESGVKI